MQKVKTKNLFDKTVIIIVVIAFIVFASSALPKIFQKEECPSSCTDYNACTRDICSEETDFKCQHIKLDGEQQGCSEQGCEIKSCEKGVCKLKSVKDNCCGNNRCETVVGRMVDGEFVPEEEGENFETCPQDCSITEKECREFEEEGNSFVFKYYEEECKNHQILVCRNLEVRNCDKFWEESGYDDWDCRDEGKYDRDVYGNHRAICLLNMANNYLDPEICEFLFQEGEYDEYWYCKAKFVYGRSACSNIDSDFWLQECFKATS